MRADMTTGVKRPGPAPSARARGAVTFARLAGAARFAAAILFEIPREIRR